MPRRYSGEEAAIALVLSQITRVPLQLRAVKEIADRLRKIINFGPTVGVTDPMWWNGSDDGEWALRKKIEETEEEATRLRHQGVSHNEATWAKEEEHRELVRQLRGLEDWAPMQIAIQSLQRVHWRTSSRCSSSVTQKPSTADPACHGGTLEKRRRSRWS